MTKINDFDYLMRKYLTHYLPIEMNFNTNTIDTYRYAFILLLEYFVTIGIKAERITVGDLTRERIMSYLDWLEKERNSSITTRNNRLAAIHSFVRYLQYEHPDYMDEYRKILAIPFKKFVNKEMSYLTVEETKVLFQQFDMTSEKGIRNYTLIYTMYETAARVSEVASMKIGDIRTSKPYVVKVLGKGSKERSIPVTQTFIDIINRYKKVMNLENAALDHPLFFNSRGTALTRQGIAIILNVYVSKARTARPDLFSKVITPHSMRHTRAMHLLGDDVNLVYIRDILGHQSVTTTERYARVDSKKKREALEKAYRNFSNPTQTEEWKNTSVLEWLKSFDS